MFGPQALLFVGVARALKDEAGLGDVVVARGCTPYLRRLTAQFAYALVATTAVTVATGLADALTSGGRANLISDAEFFLTAGMASALMLGLGLIGGDGAPERANVRIADRARDAAGTAGWLNTPVDLTVAPSPASVLRRARVAAVTWTAVCLNIVVGSVVLAGIWSTRPGSGTAYGCGLAALVSILALTSNAWGKLASL